MAITTFKQNVGCPNVLSIDGISKVRTLKEQFACNRPTLNALKHCEPQHYSSEDEF
jgi:hypothetical protein